MASLLNSLSDCVLLSLLEYLDGTTLYQISQVNPRFEDIVLKRSLWKRIDARSEPNHERKIKYVLDRVHNKTERLLLKGRKAYPRVIRMIQSKSFESLTILALENQFINQRIKLGDFPKSLIELSFKNSMFDMSGEFFRKSYEAMENLKVLIMDGCLHVHSSTLMSVSKYPNLEIFSCYKCPIENSIAYFSIAVSNGFKKIKVFDVRLSGLGNTFLKAFMKKPNILVIYFQNSDKSYEIDFKDRVAEALKQNLPVPKVTINTLPITGTEDVLVTDLGTLDFSRTTPIEEDCQLPDSYLYTYPYRPCSCGFTEKQEEYKLMMGECERVKSAIYIRSDERKLIEIINKDNMLGDDDNQEINDDTDDESEGGYETGNGDIEEEQSCDKASASSRAQGGASTSSAQDGNSPLDGQNQNPSQSCTEIIYTLLPRRTTKDQSVGTDTDTPPEGGAERNEGVADQPSTSGLSGSLRKRKLSGGAAVDEGGKKRREEDYYSHSSSSDDDDDAKPRGAGPSSSRSPNDEGKMYAEDLALADLNKSEVTARLLASREIVVRRTPPPDANRGSSHAASTSRYRRRRSPPVERPRDVRPARPAHTQVFQCACGAHSVIVVTADETADGEGPPAHPPENYFHSHHCEQRININAHQSLRVINRDQVANARPEVELVEINRNKALKCGLKQLSFRGYHRVTNLTLKSLEHLRLDLLDLTYTQCTKHGVLDFLRLNPNCRVLHKEFCVCKPRMDF